MNQDRLHSLVDRIGETALSPDLWPETLVELSAFADARGAAIIPVFNVPMRIEATESLAGLFHAYVNDGWISNDLRYRCLPKMLQTGIAIDLDFIDADAMAKEPYYESFLRPHGLRHFAGLGITAGGGSWALTLQRGIAQDPYSREEQARLQLLLEPLRQAARLSAALGEAHAMGTLESLSQKRTACLLLDVFGRVAHLNAAAEQLVGPILDIRQRRLVLRSRQRTAELASLISRCLSQRPGVAVPTNGSMLFGEGRTLHALRVTQLRGTRDSIFRTFHALIEISPVVASIDVDEAIIGRSFGLTQRESALLRSLMRTTDLRTAATSLGISYETARNYLRSIFLKTDCNSQLELASLMAGLVARL